MQPARPGPQRLDPATGIAVKTSQPSDTGGSSVGTTQTRFYTNGTLNNANCVNNAWYMQVSAVGPASQVSPRPTGMADLTTTSTTYDWLLGPTTVTQTVTDSGSTVQTRTSTTSYENSGISPRALTRATTNSIQQRQPGPRVYCRGRPHPPDRP